MNRRWPLFFAVALAGAALDIATKSLVFSSRFELGETVPVLPGLLSIQLTVNKGIAWGLFPSAVWMAVSLAAAPAIAYFFLRRPAGLGETLCGSLILAGTIGNGWDRLLRGHVRDWILVRPIPNFNVADALLTTSVAVLFLLWMRHDRRPVRDAGPAQAGEPHDGGLGDVGRDHGSRP